MKLFNKQYLVGILPCIVHSLLCGFITGAAIFLFKIAAKKAEQLSLCLYRFASGSVLFAVLGFVFLAAMAWVMVQIHKKVPEAKGGGIPRSEGILRGLLPLRRLPTLLGTVGGSLVSYLCGLPVGTEGPAVMIGTSLGGMCSGLSKSSGPWRRYVMTGGAGAGFAVATGAPLTAILFSLEELQKRFSPLLMLSVSLSVLGATYTNRLLCGAFRLDPALLHIPRLSSFGLQDVGYLLLLGLLTALAVGCFDKSIELCSSFTRRYKSRLTPQTRVFLTFLLTGLLGFVFVDGIHSGHDTILLAAEGHYSFVLLVVLLAVRLLMMLLVTDSGVTGGIFIPTLAIGAVAAAIIARLLVAAGMDPRLFSAAVLLGMCAFIGGTLRAPLTAAVLFVELTGHSADLFFVAVTVFATAWLVQLMDITPFYDRTLEGMEEAYNKGKAPVLCHFEATVAPDSFAAGKAARELIWPASTLVISIARSENEPPSMVHVGEQVLRPGDRLTFRSNSCRMDAVTQQLEDLLGSSVTRIDD